MVVKSLENILDELVRDLPIDVLAAVQSDTNRSFDANLLAYAASKGFIMDAKYEEATFAILVSVHLKPVAAFHHNSDLIRPTETGQPIIFCTMDKFDDICTTMKRAFGMQDDPRKEVRVVWGGCSYQQNMDTHPLFFPAGIRDTSLVMTASNTSVTLRLLKTRGGVDRLDVYSVGILSAVKVKK